jgi:hypothetical protein
VFSSFDRPGDIFGDDKENWVQQSNEYAFVSFSVDGKVLISDLVVAPTKGCPHVRIY